MPQGQVASAANRQTRCQTEIADYIAGRLDAKQLEIN